MALPTAIITNLIDVTVDPGNPLQVIVSIEYRLLFVPNDSSPPLDEQADLTLLATFTQLDLRLAAQAQIIASAAAKGGTLLAARILGVSTLL